MTRRRTVNSLSLVILLMTISFGQTPSATGGLKGKVRLEGGTGAEGVAVIITQDEQEVGRTKTNRKGEVVLERLVPGLYTLTFRKAGLSVGTMTKVEVQGGKTRSLPDKLTLTVDEGSLALIKGSVFNAEGRSMFGVRVELARLDSDGKSRKIDGRITNDSGEFGFRLRPDRHRYVVTAFFAGAEPVSKEVDVDGAAVYRLALSPLPKTK